MKEIETKSVTNNIIMVAFRFLWLAFFTYELFSELFRRSLWSGTSSNVSPFVAKVIFSGDYVRAVTQSPAEYDIKFCIKICQTLILAVFILC